MHRTGSISRLQVKVRLISKPAREHHLTSIFLSGPYFGQRAWFTLYHPEKDLTSVLDRYGNEIRRVIGVINSQLKKTGKPNLVGDKVTYADLAFVPWFWLIVLPPHLMGEDFTKEWETTHPEAWAWFQRLQALPSVTKVREDRLRAMGK